MEASIKQKRETMELCQTLIPMMNEEEIGLIALVLNKTVERMIIENRVEKE